MQEDDFRRMMDFHGIRLEKTELNKLIERFIDSHNYTIDTRLIIDIMYEDIPGEKPQDDYLDIIKTPIIGKIARKIQSKGLCETLIINLKKRDISTSHYLEFNEIKEAFHESNFKLSNSQTEDMLKGIRKSLRGEYNYHILL